MNQKKIAHIGLMAIIFTCLSTISYFVFVKKSIPVIQQPPISSSQTPTPEVISLSISTVFHGENGGCSNIFVYKTNDDNTLGISVSANKNNLNLSTTPKTFTVGEIDGLEVELLTGQNISSLYCNDVVDLSHPRPRKLLGKSGVVQITVTEVDEARPRWDRNYNATVILEDVQFIEENGDTSDLYIDRLLFENVKVGWLPG